MKKLLLLLPFLLAPAPVMARHVNHYNVCVQYREVYTPGYYDIYGNYVSGGVSTQSYNVPCKYPKSYHHNGHLRNNNIPARRSCAAAPIGAILGGVAGYKATPRVADRWYMIPLGVFGGSVVGSALC
jgi:hypothetical protein